MQEADYKALRHCLPNIDIFSSLPMAGIERLMSSIHLYSVKKGERVFAQGSPGDAVYIVQEGEVAVLRKKVFFLPAFTAAVLGPGQIFGEMSLLERRPHSASAKAIRPSRLFVLMASAFDMLCQQNPAFCNEIKSIAEERRFQNSHAR